MPAVIGEYRLRLERVAINEPPRGAPIERVVLVVIGSMILLSAVSAAGSLALARRAISASR